MNINLSSISFQGLKEVLFKMFERVNIIEYKSVAVPALGTGNLNYPPALVAQRMFDAAVEFDAHQKVPQNHFLTDISFVIYEESSMKVYFFFARFRNSFCDLLFSSGR